MKADFTRVSFDSLKHFTRVVMQQGRVQLDADWNEQAAILLRYIQALAADFIGPHGGPTADLGFQIADNNNTGNDLAITPGHYYVDGILCELMPLSAPVPISFPKAINEHQFQVPSWSVSTFTGAKNSQVLLAGGSQGSILDTIKDVTPNNDGTAVVTVGATMTNFSNASSPQAYLQFTTYQTQPDYPAPPPLATGSFLIYLDVWERLITYIEDDSIREVALNGADTAARAKLVCQVKQMSFSAQQKPDCLSIESLRAQLQPDNRGLLMAQAQQKSAATDPCIIAPDATYRGPENQLYRIEIHTGGAAGSGGIATFKWSRENGSVVFPIVSLTAGATAAAATTTVVLESLGRDDRFGLSESDWVEIQDDDYVLRNTAGSLRQVQAIDMSKRTITLNGAAHPNADMSKHPLLRRWDQTFGDPSQGGLQQQSSDNPAALLVEGRWLNLEDGIQIQFQPAPQGSNHLYRTGDYWLIPARTATGDIEWPKGDKGDPLAMPPDGVEHHYAPLAVINVAASTVTVSQLCQKDFPQLKT